MITIIHNNEGPGDSAVPSTPSLEERGADAEALRTAWGFAAVVDISEGRVLFDVGVDGEVLLHNARALGIDLSDVGAIVLSHADTDHTGGLSEALSECAPGCTVYTPGTFPSSITDKVKAAGGKLVETESPTEICEGVASTGPVPGWKVEQGLVITAPLAGADFGPVLVTGCAHPGIAKMARSAALVAGESPKTVLGGFHMGELQDEQIRAVADELREIGVVNVGPTHCTGESAREFFRSEWSGSFVDADLGAVIDMAGQV